VNVDDALFSSNFNTINPGNTENPGKSVFKLFQSFFRLWQWKDLPLSITQ